MQAIDYSKPLIILILLLSKRPNKLLKYINSSERMKQSNCSLRDQLNKYEEENDNIYLEQKK